MTISVFLLDDHELVRRGLADLLEVEHDITVVGEAPRPLISRTERGRSARASVPWASGESAATQRR
jgi:DNA-binding NarL/FixJ family response regulator